MWLVDISIVSLNQRSDLEQLLPVLMRGFDDKTARVMLLDNRSTDGTHKYVSNKFPSIIYRRNDNVTGYGGNHNMNLARCSAKYFCIINADMIVDAAQIMKLVYHLERDLDVVAASGRVLGPDGIDQALVKRYPSIAVLAARLMRLTGRIRMFRSLNERYETRDLGYEHTRDAEIVSGAFLLVRTTELKRIGGFDDRYFLYFEDFDLCMRMRRLGNIRYYSDVCAIHHWHRDAHKSFRHTWWFISSALRFFRIHGFRLWNV